jgi:hypothetical protein
MVAPKHNNPFQNKKTSDKTKHSGGDKNPICNLNEKSFDELYNITLRQMGLGIHPTDIQIRMEMPGQPVEDSGMMVLGTQKKPDENSYDAHFLMCRFNESLGELLATHPSIDIVKGLDSKLEILYLAAKKCEEQVEAVNQPIRSTQSELFKGFFSTTPYSIEIKGCQLILKGYSSTDPQISLDEVAKNLYEISGIKDITRIEEFVINIDRFTQGIGQTIKANRNETLTWKLGIFKPICFRLTDQNFNYWSRDFDEDSIEHRTIETHSRKVWACWNIIAGYMKGKYGDSLNIPESIILQQESEVASRFNQELQMKLIETSKRTFPSGITISTIPSLIDKYLLTIGVERGKHYN